MSSYWLYPIRIFPKTAFLNPSFMNIRPYKDRSDRNQLIALWQECGLVKPQNNPDKDINRKLRVNPELLLVGVLQNKIIASVMGGYEGHRGWINYLAVHPSQQRKGYGKLIMQAVEALIYAEGCAKINLQIRVGNETVAQFYRALGYCDDAVISLGKRLQQD